MKRSIFAKKQLRYIAEIWYITIHPPKFQLGEPYNRIQKNCGLYFCIVNELRNVNIFFNSLYCKL